MQFKERHPDNVAPVFAISRHRLGIDGEGITTLVTFMGCPLHCAYCLNDECHWQESVEVRNFTPKELYDTVKIDRLYFQTTVGGVCLGGGEPTLYPDFITEFVSVCDSQWRTTVETALGGNMDDIKGLCPLIDHWIIDVKDLNPYIFHSYTGRKDYNMNHRLEMFQSFNKKGHVTIKVPHIPDYNTKEDVLRSINVLRNLGFEDIQEVDYIKIRRKPEYEQR